MSALLTKEFLCIIKQVKLLLLGLCIACAGLVPSLSSQGSAFPDIAALTAMLTVIFPINAMAYEEKTNWDVFVKSLPLGTRTIVGSKYLLVVIFSIVGALLTFAASMFTNLTPEMRASVCIISTAAGAVVCSILLPLMYRFGVQKSRLAFFLLLFPLPVLCVVVSNRMQVPSSVLRVAPAAVPVLLAASFLLSCKIYSRKEM